MILIVTRPCLRLLSVLFLIVCSIQIANADPGKPIGARLHLTHLSADVWRADYELPEPVENIHFDPAGAYRSQSWRLLTPGLKLERRNHQEVITAGGKRFSSISVEVALYLPYDEGNYTAFDRFSDGGTDVYVGFFAGAAQQGTQQRSMRLDVKLTGLPNENVIPTNAINPEEPDYAYFGPATPTPFGAATILLDPQLPAWLVPEIQQTTAKVTSYFDQVWHRKLAAPPLILISYDPAPAKGLSFKGGAFDNKLVFRFGGDALRREGNPIVRRHLVEVVAHELAHIWQRNVARGGVGGDDMWVHEGGAEAIAVAALGATGLFTKEEADAYAAKLLAECDGLKGSVTTYRGYYACGFTRFHGYPMDVFGLWKKMMESSESSGEFYSQKMIESILKDARKNGAAL
jgi:hypothetical protein